MRIINFVYLVHKEHFALRKLTFCHKQYRNVACSLRAMLIYFFLISQPLNAYAADHLEKLWSVFTLSGNYGRVVYSVEPQLRLVYKDNPFQQFLTNAGVGYKVGENWQIWFGQTLSADSQDAVAGSADEYRLWQQIIWTHRLSTMSLLSRTRFEERKSLFFPAWAYRLRQRVQLNKPLTQNLSLVMSDELFFNINQADWITTKPFDQNRAYIGVEQRLSKSTYLGAGYMNQYLSTPISQFNNVLWINFRVDLEQTI